MIMCFFKYLQEKYASYMQDRKFSDRMNALEINLFNEHPEYLDLPVYEQNKVVEAAYVKKYGDKNEILH